MPYISVLAIFVQLNCSKTVSSTTPESLTENKVVICKILHFSSVNNLNITADLSTILASGAFKYYVSKLSVTLHPPYFLMPAVSAF